ncbi:MAG: hypothetical protein AAF355_02715 [Myxococcota bacterium]
MKRWSQNLVQGSNAVASDDETARNVSPILCLALCACTAVLCGSAMLGGCGSSSSNEQFEDGGVLCEAGADCPDAGNQLDATTLDAESDSSKGGSCATGAACNPARGCPTETDTCLPEQSGALTDVAGHPKGRTSFPTTDFSAGYCSLILPFEPETPETCPPEEDDPCGPCATCVQYFVDANACMADCAPNVEDNSSCRNGYECDLGSRVCLPGCLTDDECRIFRADTNGDGVIDPSSGQDLLTYDTESNAVCDLESFRCTFVGAEGAEAGDTCERDSECESNGSCLREETTGWSGGYCTKFGCDVAANGCAPGGVCQERGVGTPLCLSPCTAGPSAPGSDTPAEWIDDTSGCREGYSCVWGGIAGAGSTNGGCVAGLFNAVIDSSTIGLPCTAETEDQCYSPFGLGECRSFGCTVVDCGVPGMPSDVCGPGNVCAGIDGSTTSFCLQTCTQGSDCAGNFACWRAGLGPDGFVPGSLGWLVPGGTGICFDGCVDAAQCGSGETCEGADAKAGVLGVCTTF